MIKKTFCSDKQLIKVLKDNIANVLTKNPKQEALNKHHRCHLLNAVCKCVVGHNSP